MNRRLLTILLIAFFIAGICAFLVYRIVGKSITASRPTATTEVVAAKADIQIGVVLTAADLTTVSIAGSVPKGAILKPEEAVGRGVISEIYQGEPILDNRLAAPGSGGGLAATIPPGMRASAVKVDDVVGVAGFVTPGMRVDVLVSGVPPNAPQSSAPITVTKTVLQNIQVLSAGTDIQKDATGKPQQVQVVNLLVTPDQAQTLSLASQLKIQLVLRNPLDTKTTEVPSNSMVNLFTGTVAPTAAPQVRRVVKSTPPPSTYKVQIINGNKTSEQKFANPEGQK